MSKNYSRLISSIRRRSDPTIALDLDGVCSKTRRKFVSNIGNRYQINIPNHRFFNSSMKLPEISNTFGEEIELTVEKNPDIYSEMPVMNGAALATRTLNRTFNIKIVSSRFSQDWLNPDVRSKVYDNTKKWLDSNNFAYDEIVNPVPSNKKDISADIYIDDSADVMNSLEDTYSLGIFFLRPHNIDHYSNSQWDASKESNQSIDDLARNPSQQWSLVTDFLREN